MKKLLFIFISLLILFTFSFVLVNNSVAYQGNPTPTIAPPGDYYTFLPIVQQQPTLALP